MSKDEQPQIDITKLTGADYLTFKSGTMLSALTEPGMVLFMGKNYPGRVFLSGSMTLLGAVVLFPQANDWLVAFALIWALLLIVHKIIGVYEFHFGRRRHTEYVGYPILGLVIPLNEQIVRRFINPIALFWAADYAMHPVLIGLLKLSALGHAVVGHYLARVRRADEDGRHNAQWELNNYTSRG